MKPSDERYTPESVLEVVRAFDVIALDPCTTSDNPVCAENFYTLQDNGLLQNWKDLLVEAKVVHTERAAAGGGVIFCNCPYSRGELRRWVAKCILEADRGVEIIALLPCDLGSVAGRNAASTADALCFVRGRLTFGSPDGQLPQGAKQPSVLVYWGERSKRFRLVFEDLGTVWRR